MAYGIRGASTVCYSPYADPTFPANIRCRSSADTVSPGVHDVVHLTTRNEQYAPNADAVGTDRLSQVIDGGARESHEARTIVANYERAAVDHPTPSSKPTNDPSPAAPRLIIVLASCVAAVIGLLGISLAFYIAAFICRHGLRSGVIISQTAWEMLPHAESQFKDDIELEGDSPWTETRTPSPIAKPSHDPRWDEHELLVFSADAGEADAREVFTDMSGHAGAKSKS